jgi:predicted DNA-binding transcriptional regulator YafY
VYKQNTDESRVVRLTQIQHFLHKNKAGLTSKELAQLCGTTIRTIQRDLLVLQSDLHIPITEQGHDRYGIIKDYVLPPVSYSLYEALVLFLAARLIIRQTDDNNPHIKSALVKLTSAMPKSLGINLRKSIANFGKRLVDLEELDVFEKIAIAWVTQKRVKIIYQSLNRDQDKEWLVNPYFIEMTGVGYSTYLIGYGESADRNGITTFKVNRIKEVTILDEDFAIPEDFSIEKLLGASWGVMWGDEIIVKLKFSANVARRVKETVWHQSQQIQDLPDGSCILTLQVGSTLEMTPWIRGWGADVEVLEPPELREQFKNWAKQLGEMYGISSQVVKAFL